MSDTAPIISISLQNEMKDCYIDYAMSVIVGRALPDARDGLKPVHRRILYAMHEQGFASDKPYRKSARIVGEVLGKYHPHGDQAVYQTMVRMVQEFSMREPLIDGHGNFGSIDGDSPAAQRYTEARLAAIAETLLTDIERDTVDWQGNFDNSLEEPRVLPAKFPNLLVNGSAGIAVGMATNIPPHNLGEVIDGTIALIENPELPEPDLFRLIPGPDFPTGGLILGRKGIIEAYKSGRGSITQRGVVEVEEENKQTRIIIKELPFQVNKANLIIAIAELVKEKKVEGIRDLRDESDRDGMRVVIELKRDADANVVLHSLYKQTQLQNNFGVINLVLVNNRPELLPLKRILLTYIQHSREVIRRRTQFDLKKAEERAHILEGLKIAIDHIDEVIKIIRGATDTKSAGADLMSRFGLSERQAKAILEMRLSNLTSLERSKIERELADTQARITDYRDILANPKRVDEIIKTELLEIKNKFADPRRSRIVEDEQGDIDPEDLVADEPCVITVSARGYIKRSLIDEFRAMGRGRQGVTGASLKEDDGVTHCFVTTAHAYILVFTSLGRVYRLRAYQVPEASRAGVGKFIVNLCQFQPNEKMTTLLCASAAEFTEPGNHLLFASKLGQMVRVSLDSFQNIRTNGIIAIGLNEGDELISVARARENTEVILLSRDGMAIRFAMGDVRSTGRGASGVRGMKLREGDLVVAMETLEPEEQKSQIFFLTVTRNGYGKKSPITEYSAQNRGGLGVIDIITDERNGEVVGMKKVNPGDEMLLVTQNGKLIRTRADEVRAIGRRTKGVRLITLKNGDALTGFAIIDSKWVDRAGLPEPTPLVESAPTE